MLLPGSGCHGRQISSQSKGAEASDPASSPAPVAHSPGDSASSWASPSCSANLGEASAGGEDSGCQPASGPPWMTTHPEAPGEDAAPGAPGPASAPAAAAPAAPATPAAPVDASPGRPVHSSPPGSPEGPLTSPGRTSMSPEGPLASPGRTSMSPEGPSASPGPPPPTVQPSPGTAAASPPGGPSA